MENEADKKRLIEEMEKVGIVGVNSNMSVKDLVGMYKKWKKEQEQKRQDKFDRKSCLERIANTKKKTKVKKVKGVLVAPDNYMEIYEDEIDYCGISKNLFVVFFTEGGKYFYNIKTGDRIK